MKTPLIIKLNLAKHICDHMLGEHHSQTHRCMVGVGVMIIGVAVAKTPVPHVVIHFVCDLTGYLIHGIGAIPILEQIAKQSTR
jgi:hypothetical protein